MNCETDFVARTDDFEALCRELAALVRDNEIADVEALLKLSAGGGSAQDRVTKAVGKLGENIQVRRFARFQLGGDGSNAGE